VPLLIARAGPAHDHGRVNSIRLAACLAVLGVLLVIVGLAKGFGAGSSGGSVGCAAQRPGGPQVAAHDPCARSQAGWNDVGYALIAPGVLAVVGAASIRLTARR
jgi:hypothetical protein